MYLGGLFFYFQLYFVHVHIDNTQRTVFNEHSFKILKNEKTIGLTMCVRKTHIFQHTNIFDSEEAERGTNEKNLVLIFFFVELKTKKFNSFVKSLIIYKHQYTSAVINT